MSEQLVVGLVTPSGEAAVPSEAPELYPDVEFLTAGVGVQSLTPAGYDAAVIHIVDRAKELAERGAAVVGLSGTSLTFYRGSAFHEELKERARAAAGRPVTSMSTGIVEGLQAFGARRVAVGTAYSDVVNERLRQYLTDSGFEVLSMEGLGLIDFGAPSKVTGDEIVALGERAVEAASGAQPDALLLSCGGLKTLDVTAELEEKCGVPVVSSRPAFLWSVMRLAGRTAPIPGYGRLLAGETAAAAS